MTVASGSDGVRELVIVAGDASHSAGLHEFRAGALLLARALQFVPELHVTVVSNGTIPELDPAEVDALVLYSDGGPSHPLLAPGALDRVERLARAGAGIGVLHYAVEAYGAVGEAVTRWIGGRYVEGESCNPLWEARFETLPDHPVTRGVEPFTLPDEWYLNIRFAGDEDPGVRTQPLLVGRPSAEVRLGPYVWPAGPYQHIVAAEGRPETLMWAAERDGGGRGVGLTGGHFHHNWADRDFRTIVLNALVWLTGLDVPAGGVASSVTDDDLSQNLDEKPAVG